MNHDLDPTAVAYAIGNGLKQLAGYLGGAAVFLSVLWFAVEPRVERYLIDTFNPFSDQIHKLVTTQQDIIKLLEDRTRIKPFIAFYARPMIARTDHDWEPGEIITIYYFLQRNEDCETVVEARFYSFERGSIDNTLTHRFEATRAPVSEQPLFFPLRLKIPDQTQPGRYSYAPVAIPVDCNDQERVFIPPSDFFEVK